MDHRRRPKNPRLLSALAGCSVVAAVLYAAQVARVQCLGHCSGVARPLQLRYAWPLFLPAPPEFARHSAPTAAVASVPLAFQWPIAGRIAPKSSPESFALRLVGQSSATVSAAEEGVVAFVAAPMKGLGCVILVQHAGGWISVCAKMGHTFVQRGDAVRRGQPLGALAAHRAPDLVFELYKNGRPQDPMRHLDTNMRRPRAQGRPDL